MNDQKVEERMRSSWARRWGKLPWVVRKLPIAILIAVVLAGIPFTWTRIEASGYEYDEAQFTGTADVVLVLGTAVAPGGTQPMDRLRGRLDTAAQLVRSGRAKVILVSGDAGGSSGNETLVMSNYLERAGIERNRIVTDPFGLDTYDSCLRAKTVYGVDRALVVTQGYHLPRAVTLCRHVGIDADGIRARCDTCDVITRASNWARDFMACSKAGLDAYRDRPAAIDSPSSPAIAEALASLS